MGENGTEVRDPLSQGSDSGTPTNLLVGISAAGFSFLNVEMSLKKTLDPKFLAGQLYVWWLSRHETPVVKHFVH